MNTCIFCGIIAEKSPADIIYKDDDVLVFKPLNPIAKGHVLIVPKEHCENIFEIDPTILAKLTATAQKFARNAVEKLNATGINLLHASGKDAQQSVFHFHFHLVPRYLNDGLDLWIGSGIERK